MFKIRKQFTDDLVCDSENVLLEESPVVSGQALTGDELARRQSAGLPVGCAVRQFNQVNPYLEKFSIYDAIGNYRMRHGMVDKTEVNASVDDVPKLIETNNEPSPSETN